MQRWGLWWRQKALCLSSAGLGQRTKEARVRWLVGGDLRANEGPELEGSCRFAGPNRRCWPQLGAWNCKLLGNVQGYAGNGRRDSVAFSSHPHGLLWRQTSASTLSVSVRFSVRKNRGRGLQICRTATACLGFFFGSRTTLEKRLLWVVVKDNSKPLAGCLEKQSDGRSCSVSLPLIVSLAFPWLD